MSDDSIKKINVADEMSKSFLDYSMSVIVSRALPDARDGLKPSQRRLLYAMHHDLSLSASKPHLKCARIVGETMGKYHPHGDGAIYPTMVNMAQPWTMRETLVDGQGNFGSVEGDAPAAMRYTEARLTHLGSSMMTDLEKRTVDHHETYDGNSLEPEVLPASIPNLLVNGGTGIAVGMATNIPSHNLGEVIDGICAKIENPQITVEEIKEFIKGPDFAGACEIRGYKGIDNYFRTGRGSVKIRGVMDVQETSSGTSQIIIKQVPHGVNRATLKKGKNDSRIHFLNNLIKKLENIDYDFYGFQNKEPIWGNEFYKALIGSKMGLNLSRGLPTKYYSSNRIASLMGNGLLTFVDRKTQLGDIFKKNEIIFYDSIEDLSKKIKFYKKNDNIRKKIASNGKRKYFKLFNESKITKYITDISTGKNTNIF